MSRDMPCSAQTMYRYVYIRPDTHVRSRDIGSWVTHGHVTVHYPAVAGQVHVMAGHSPQYASLGEHKCEPLLIVVRGEYP